MRETADQKIISQVAYSPLLRPINQEEARGVAEKIQKELGELFRKRRGAKLKPGEFMAIAHYAIHAHWGEKLHRDEGKEAWRLVMGEYVKLSHPQLRLKFPSPRKRDIVA